MTSIEWLEMEIVKLEAKFAIPHAIYELCEQAKKTNENEIINAVNLPKSERWFDASKYNSAGEQYYSQTFKKD